MNKKLLTPLLLAAALLPAVRAEETEDHHECTSWVVMSDLTGGKTVLLHKNRDSKASWKTNLFVVKAEGGKRAWIGISNGPQKYPSANTGVNDCGVAISMNNGDQTDAQPGPPSSKGGLGTPTIAKEALENCATAEEAVKFLHELVKAKKYSHGKYGSIWVVADPNRAFIVENDTVRFAAHEVRSGFGIRANGWQFPEMMIYSQYAPKTLANFVRREFSVRRSLFADGTKYNEPVTVEKVNAASRVDSIPEDTKCPPVCGGKTRSGCTIAIDREYPGVLSTLYAAFGHPRYTVYLPVPFVLDKIPVELTDDSFSTAVYARSDNKRELLPQDKLAEFERELNKRQEEAVEQARAVLKKGGSKADAAKILNAAFQKNWEAVKKLSAGK